MTVNRDTVLLQLYARARAPCRDYYGLTISENFVILNIWNISYGPHVFPKRHKVLVREFCRDRYLQGEVKRLFSASVLEYALGLSRKERNLQYLPTKLFLYILRHLAANDILHLSQTSKIFFELCNSENVWKILYRKRLKKRPTYEDNRLAEKISWKEIVKSKIVKSTGRTKKIVNERASLVTTKITKTISAPNQIKELNKYSSSSSNLDRNTIKSFYKPDTSKSFSNLTMNKNASDKIKCNQTKSISNLTMNNRSVVNKPKIAQAKANITITKNNFDKINKTDNENKDTNKKVNRNENILSKQSINKITPIKTVNSVKQTSSKSNVRNSGTKK